MLAHCALQCLWHLKPENDNKNCAAGRRLAKLSAETLRLFWQERNEIWVWTSELTVFGIGITVSMKWLHHHLPFQCVPSNVRPSSVVGALRACTAMLFWAPVAEGFTNPLNDLMILWTIYQWGGDIAVRMCQAISGHCLRVPMYEIGNASTSCVTTIDLVSLSGNWWMQRKFDYRCIIIITIQSFALWCSLTTWTEFWLWIVDWLIDNKLWYDMIWLIDWLIDHDSMII